MAIEARLRTMDRAVLADHARSALGRATAEVADWQVRRLGYSEVNPVSGGLYRLAGTARDGGAGVPWSLVLKVVRAPGGGTLPDGSPVAPGWGTDPAHSRYWRREPLAYRSGLLADLPRGLAAPRCFSVEEPDGETAWLWLEDVAEDAPGAWPLGRYGLAARHLVRFNGACLAGRPLPDAPWLSRALTREWAPEWPLELVRDPRDWAHPLLRAAFPVPVVERLAHLWADREPLLDALERQPRALCHHDAARANLFSRRGADGEEWTVAVDWAFLGLGAPGEELAHLVILSLLVGQVAMADAPRLGELALAGYLAGLRDAGWLVPDAAMERAVRFGYAAAAALRWSFLVAGYALRAARDEATRAAMERALGRPFAAILAGWAALLYFLLDRADEARIRLPTVGNR